MWWGIGDTVLVIHVVAAQLLQSKMKDIYVVAVRMLAAQRRVAVLETLHTQLCNAVPVMPAGVSHDMPCLGNSCICLQTEAVINCLELIADNLARLAAAILFQHPELLLCHTVWSCGRRAVFTTGHLSMEQAMSA